ncbi:transcription antitermination factor NusB [Blattabacterium cuenoti]|uniref:transcription antitermination factor NusB n=1 Tax=Blattabacterium cuenoti TaxID=1653831 RepID=UPI00163BD006|nr:transcription antitermination factor NusB [Blattabacterium cuenoti]
MSIRRYFRIKSMQFLYAQKLSKVDLYKVESLLINSTKKLSDLYIYFLCLILRIRNHALKLYDEYKLRSKNKNKENNNNELKINFIKNIAYNNIIKILSTNESLIKEYNSKSKKELFKKQDKWIFSFLKEMEKTNEKTIYFHELISSFEEEKKFIIKYYKFFFLFNDNLIEYLNLEKSCFLNEESNLDVAHKMVCETFFLIKKTDKDKDKYKNNYILYNTNKENKKFFLNLYRNTIIHKEKFNNIINKISNNWKVKRIATIDLIILQMAICEFLYFPNIPPKVTMNEYIEITKIFCMEKSKIFINGILDQTLKLLQKENKIFKIGKGLM